MPRSEVYTPKGGAQQDDELAVLRRCLKCGKGLFRNAWFIGKIEMDCPRCKELNVFESDSGQVAMHGAESPVVRELRERVEALMERAPRLLSPEEVFEVMESRWEQFLRRRRKERAEIATGLRFEVFKRDNFHCRYCGRGVEDVIVLHVDHVVPRVAGGPDTLDNLVTACSSCNLGKGPRPLETPAS